MIVILLAAVLTTADVPPLPDIQTIKQRALERARESAKDLERYSCNVASKEDTLRPDGSVKQTTTKEFERFFVNGREVDHLLKKNGLELNASDASKEQRRVDKEVRQDTDAKRLDKMEREDVKQIDEFLRALRFTNGHREVRDGRTLVVYDLSGDPAFKPKSLLERFAHALDGRIWIDEKTGSPAQMEFRTDRDVKIAAGLANVHKGFRLHVTQQLLGENVWIENTVHVQGDARALFSTARFRAHEAVGQCRLYNVDTQTKTEKPK